MEVEFERIDEHNRVASYNGQRWFVRRLEHVDLWQIKTEKGPVPQYLDGQFTAPSYAYDRIKNYVEAYKKKG